jgi:hypothetical protein
MEIEPIKLAYERWRKADAEWIDRTLELAAALAQARREHKSDNDFGIWLKKGEVGVSEMDRKALIHFGRDLNLARQILNATESRSPQMIWKRFRQAEKRSGRTTRPDSAKSKKDKKGVGRPRTRDTEFAPKLLAAIRRKRKEAHDVRVSRRWRPEAINKIMLHDLLNAVEQFLEDFINHRKMSFDIIEAVKRDPRAAERSIDYVTQDQCGVREFDA